MSKKEALLPDSTVGGRIQKLRHQKNLSRSEFYDRVFLYGEAGSDESKEKTVRSWEYGKYELNYQTMKTVCRVLGCSSDYLLGLDECTNKSNQFIHDQIGLSESSIERLKDLKFYLDSCCIRALDFLLSLNTFEFGILEDLCIYYDIERDLYDKMSKVDQIDYSSFPEYESVVAAGLDPYIFFGVPYLETPKEEAEQSEYHLNKTFMQVMQQFEDAAKSDREPQLSWNSHYQKQ